MSECVCVCVQYIHKERKCGFETAIAGVFISHKCYNNIEIEADRKGVGGERERKRYFMLFAEIEGAENEIGASAAAGTNILSVTFYYVQETVSTMDDNEIFSGRERERVGEERW